MKCTTETQFNNPFADFFNDGQAKTKPPKEHFLPGLRIRAEANPETQTWHFRIDAGDYRQPMAVDGGALPANEFGWDAELSAFYALSRAARWLEDHRPNQHVSMTCIGPRFHKPRGKGSARWAA